MPKLGEVKKDCCLKCGSSPSVCDCPPESVCSSSETYRPEINDAVVHGTELKRVLLVDSEGNGYVRKTGRYCLVQMGGAKLVGKFKRRLGFLWWVFYPLSKDTKSGLPRPAEYTFQENAYDPWADV